MLRRAPSNEHGGGDRRGKPNAPHNQETRRKCRGFASRRIHNAHSCDARRCRSRTKLRSHPRDHGYVHVREAESGVGVPNLRQARHARRLTSDQRAQLHADCPHREMDCPIEAAISSRLHRWDWQVFVGVLLALWLAVIVCAVAAPHLHVIAAGDSRISAMEFALIIATGCSVIFLPKAIAARRYELESASAAASGPRLDPWRRVD